MYTCMVNISNMVVHVVNRQTQQQAKHREVMQIPLNLIPPTLKPGEPAVYKSLVPKHQDVPTPVAFCLQEQWVWGLGSLCVFLSNQFTNFTASLIN